MITCLSKIKDMLKRHTIYAIMFSFFVLGSCKKDDSTTTNPTPAPSLLSGEQTGALFAEGTINDFTLAYNEGKMVLLIANNTTGKIYAVDVNDNDASKATENKITSPVTNMASKVQNAMGITGFTVMNMEVNPISNAVYVLVRNTNQTNERALFKITKGGEEITMVDLSNATYSAITFSTKGHSINDLTWGDNTMFVSMSQASTLNGEVAYLKAPFAHNSSVSSRATTVFKTNWGGNFFTDAPLETMTYGEVNGTKRLMGVTVCAPGFSFPVSDIDNGTGLLQVNEYFNLNQRSALKVFTINQNGKTYLIEFHDNGRITRVGEQYINGSQTDINAEADYLLTNGGTTVSAGFTDEDVKLLAPANSNYQMIAKYSDTQLLVINTMGAISVINI